MSQVINTNVMSLNAQRNLSTSGGQLATALQRLSSGLRINSAKDDAAGLAISERFTTQIRGMNQAIRNANDGVSLAQVGEGAMSEISNNLQRIRELAVQARNATNSDSDRAALQAEVAQRRDEIARIASQTQFNGLNLLDGSFSGAVFQVGANQGQTIAMGSEADLRVASLGEWTSIGDTFELTLDASAATLVTDGAGGDQRWGYEAVTFTLNGESFSVAASDTPVSAGDGFTSEAAAHGALATAIAAAINVEFDGAAVADGASVVVTLGNEFSLGGASANISALAGDAEALEGDEMTGFAGVDVTSVTGADNAILAMDAALDAVNFFRAEFGAIQNRFESVVANLSSSVENLSASRSRIMDTDFAAETAALTRAQVLQQAGVAMLAQANAAPQSVLALLR